MKHSGGIWAISIIFALRVCAFPIKQSQTDVRISLYGLQFNVKLGDW